MPIQFHQLKVATVRYETDAAVQIGFNIPETLKEKFHFSPGQYLTINLTIDNKKVRRAYSICSSTHEPIISILIKRVEGGLVSNYLNNEVKIGDTFGVLPPNGHFKLTLDTQEKHQYYFFGAGSGITPLISMIASVLESEPNSHCHLLYSSKDEDNIIYRKKLERLHLVYKDRFDLAFILSRPKIEWAGLVGRINKDRITDFLAKEKKSDHPSSGYFICGPGAMIESTYDSLIDLSINKELIHREYFSSPVANDAIATTSFADSEMIDAKVKVVLEGKEINLSINDNANIVQALLNENVEPPYSCLSGTCSTCMAKLEKGEVKMDVSIGLEEDEKENGFILTCQSHPLTEEVTINFDR